jgi:hypothetical protein
VKSNGRMTVIGIVVLLSVCLTPLEANADYVVSVWRNATNMTIRGAYQWGDQDWRHFEIEPGNTFGTWWNLDTPAPPLRIRFDADPGPGEDYIQYTLRVYRSATTVFNRRPTEEFQIRSDGRIELYNMRRQEY